MAVVAPHGVLFRGSSEGKIRKKLIEENLLDAVIGLPEKLFYGTGIPAAILIFRKDRSFRHSCESRNPKTAASAPDAKPGILFIDASREFKSGKNQNLLTHENIEKIVNTYREGRQITLEGEQGQVVVDKYAYLATLKEVQENDFNLNIPRYVDTFEEEEEIDLMEVRKEREELKAELAKLEEEMAGYLKELGYE